MFDGSNQTRKYGNMNNTNDRNKLAQFAEYHKAVRLIAEATETENPVIRAEKVADAATALNTLYNRMYPGVRP